MFFRCLTDKLKRPTSLKMKPQNFEEQRFISILVKALKVLKKGDSEITVRVGGETFVLRSNIEGETHVEDL